MENFEDALDPNAIKNAAKKQVSERSEGVATGKELERIEDGREATIIIARRFAPRGFVAQRRVY